MSKHRAGERDWSVPVRDTWQRAAEIAVPVLAVTGGLDAPDHVTMAERLAGLVADRRATVIDSTAHYPNMERPQAFQQAVLQFLQFLSP